MDWELARERAIRLLEDDYLSIEMIDGLDNDADTKADLESLMAIVHAAKGEANVTVSAMRCAFMLGYYYGGEC